MKSSTTHAKVDETFVNGLYCKYAQGHTLRLRQGATQQVDGIITTKRLLHVIIDAQTTKTCNHLGIDAQKCFHSSKVKQSHNLCISKIWCREGCSRETKLAVFKALYSPTMPVFHRRGCRSKSTSTSYHISPHTSIQLIRNSSTTVSHLR